MTGDQAIYLMEKFKKESMNDNKDSEQMTAEHDVVGELSELNVEPAIDERKVERAVVALEKIANQLEMLNDTIGKTLNYIFVDGFGFTPPEWLKEMGKQKEEMANE